MTVSITKCVALGGLCALLAGIGGAASAQGDYPDGPQFHGPMHHGAMHHEAMHHARHAIMRQKIEYAHAVAHGDYRAAERAHLQARAIRHHIRAHREMQSDHGDYGHGDHGQGH